MVFEIFVHDEFVGYAENVVSMIEIEDALNEKFGADAVDVYEFQPTEGWFRLEDVANLTV